MQGKKTVLLVARNATTEETAMKEIGYNVVVAASPVNAVQLAQDHAGICLVVVDSADMDSAKLILERRNLPIVFLAPAGGSEMLERDRRIAYYGCVARNSGTSVLRSVIETAFRLFDAEAQFRAVSQAAANAVILLDEQELILGWNEAAENLFGYTAQEITGSLFTRILPDLNLEQHLDADHHRVELHGLHKSGTLFPIELSLARWQSSEGRVVAAIIRDTARLTQAEDALQESEERYRSILKGSPDDITITDLEGRIRMVSPAAVTMFGFEAESEGVGRLVTEFLVPEDRARAMATVARLFQGVKSGPSEYLGVRKDGSIFDMEVHSELIRGADGRPTGMMVIVRDISDRKRAESRIKSLLAEKELLLKEVHHRITNNMSTIKALLSLQASTLKDPAAQAALKDAAGRVQSMMQLYNKLYRSANFTAVSTADYLETLLDEILRNFPNRDMVRIEKHLEPFMLDAKHLSSLGIIVNELVTNIMKYAFVGRSAGCISVIASKKENRATITIKDDGVGIAESVDITSSTGFGLELVHILSEQLGGSIRVERAGGTMWTLEFDV